MSARLSLVTGASGGIGRAVAHRLAHRGDHLVLGGTDLVALERLAAELPENTQARPWICDVADHAAVKASLRGLENLHSVVACAGICEQARIGEEGDDAVWFRTLAVNLNGAYSILKAAPPQMKPGGRIVLVASGLGKLGRAGYSAYCASKHGVLGLMKCAAKELAPAGITVNAVCPGWVDTDMARSDVSRAAATLGTSSTSLREAIERAIPLGRMVYADEVAALVEWLASADASAVTGEAYNISGGEFFA